MKRLWLDGLLVTMLFAAGHSLSAAAADDAARRENVIPPVVAPSDAFFEKFRDRDRDAARAFYKKTTDVGGLTVAASGEVADEALRRTHEIVTHLLAGRPDVIAAMAKHGTRLIIIGKDQVYTDMPEYRNHPDPAYQNERVRGTGGLDVTSFGEENLLNLAGDRYDDESIGVHEFCHTIDAALNGIDPGWRQRLRDTYRKVTAEKGLWKNAYAGSNPAEYWAEICQSYFDCNRINNWNHTSVATREQLKRYDPDGYELVRTTFKLTPQNDWRYRPLRVQPSVVPPPAKLKADPYYTKFTYAREFPVLGSKHVSDEAMLKANDTIRKMFAYRHDILKAMMNEGARLIVLGREERLSDLPELKAAGQTADQSVRYLDYTPELKLMVVPEENVLSLPGDPLAGESSVVAVFARGLHRVCASRSVDPDFDKRRQKQQYELRVKRLDVEFDEKLKKAFDEAAGRGLWKGSPGARDRVDYWAAGVLAYFDAAGTGFPASGADRPVTTRELLKAYDAGLYGLVDETMAYAEHVDWRYAPNPR